MDSRTGSAVAKVVDAVQDDLTEITDLLSRCLVKMRELESHARGINGLGSTLKSKGNEVEQIVTVLRDESIRVAAKMLAEPKPIVTIVNEQHAADVRRARQTTHKEVGV